MFVPPVVVDDSCTRTSPVAHLIEVPFGFSLKVNVDVVVPLPLLHVIVALPLKVVKLCVVATFAPPPVIVVGVQPESVPVLDVFDFPVVVRVLHVAAADAAEATPVVIPTVPSVEAASIPAMTATRVDRRSMNESPFDMFADGVIRPCPFGCPDIVANPAGSRWEAGPPRAGLPSPLAREDVRTLPVPSRHSQESDDRKCPAPPG